MKYISMGEYLNTNRDLSTMGGRMRAVREAHKLTREELAGLIGRSHRFIVNLENNQSSASLETITRMCDYMIAPMDFIVLGRDPILQPGVWGGTCRMLESIDPKYQPYVERLICDMVHYLQRVDWDIQDAEKAETKKEQED